MASPCVCSSGMLLLSWLMLGNGATALSWVLVPG